MRSRGCRCGKHLFEQINEGTCAWCGHGDCQPARTPVTARPFARLPRDLGSIAREGRRIPPVFENLRVRAYRRTVAA